MEATYTVHDATFTMGDSFDIAFNDKIVVSICGDYECGEVLVNDTFYAYYERNEDEHSVLTDEDGVVLHVLDNEDETWYNFALSKM